MPKGIGYKLKPKKIAGKKLKTALKPVKIAGFGTRLDKIDVKKRGKSGKA